MGVWVWGGQVLHPHTHTPCTHFVGTRPYRAATRRGVRTREDIYAREAATLTAWASRAEATRGRVHPEAEHPMRSPFERDRDRVIHCTAFRRLEYKTQVFVNHEGDYYRTRLTHTLEVAQIA